MRKILIVPEWYPWPDRPGLGAWVREQARAVARENEVVVLASDRSGRSLAGGFGIVEGEEDGLRVVRVRYRAAAVPKGDFAARLAGMAAALRRLRRGGFEPDVVHAHVFSAGFPALLLARRSRAPLVVSEHYSGFPLAAIAVGPRHRPAHLRPGGSGLLPERRARAAPGGCSSARPPAHGAQRC